MKKGLHIILIALSVVCFGNMYAQQAVTSAGGDASGTAGTVNYTVGQVAYSFISGSGSNLNQGVQQPYEFFITGIALNKNILLELIVYPNPTHAVVNLKIEKPENFAGMSYVLFDAKGTRILQNEIVAKITEIPMENLAAANYLLKVTNDKNEDLQTFKIIKK
jgi:hypothetical protein